MAVIAIFCDGTWNRFDSIHQTHVARLAAACAQSRHQKVLYFEGVGTGTGMASDLGRWISKVGGGLFGWGLNRNIQTAYLELCKIYQPGDRIMIFGFSRGAYTARSLVGMIRKCGIPSDPSPENMRDAFRLYRSRGTMNKPDADRVWSVRRRLSPNFATSAEDVIRRNDHSYLVRITYLGVWDTVGALGVPSGLLGPLAKVWNQRYAFHDTALSHLVEHARHAVALDEKRKTFEPSLWDNLDATPDGPGLNRGDQSSARRYQQLWFAGNHSIVGGSSEPEGLAAASLFWLWKGAEELGLKLDPGEHIPSVPMETEAAAPELYKMKRAYRFLFWLVQWRRGPQSIKDLHPTARLRAVLVPDYRPKSLTRVLPGLFRTK